MSGQFAIGVIGYFAVVNALAYGAMALDKAKAQQNLRRIPEATLLNLAFIGGSVGTVVAQQVIRHKTRKEPFRSKLAGIVFIQVLLLSAMTVAVVIAGSPAALWQILLS